MSWNDIESSTDKAITAKQVAMLKRLKIDISKLNNRREATVAIATKLKTNRLPEKVDYTREQNENAIKELWSCCEST